MRNKKLHKWLLLQDKDEPVSHIVPDFDSKPHGIPKGKNKILLADIDCPCKPKLSIDKYGKTLIIHNSFIDQERINKSLNTFNRKD